MSRIIIKESEIRNYVRSLIAEARKEINFEPEVENGVFDLDKAEMQPGSRRWLSNFFKSKGLNKPRKPQGDKVPSRMIDINTGELANSDEINKFLSDRRASAEDIYRTKAREKARSKRLGASDDSKDIRSYIDSLDGDPNDDYTQKWLRMSDKEKAAARDDIRQRRINRGVEDMKRYQTMDKQPVAYRGTKAERKEALINKIKYLKNKQAAMGARNDINDSDWKYYDMLIKDSENILRKYYNDDKIGKKNPNNDNTDDIVKNAFRDDLSTAPEFSETDVNAIDTNRGTEENEPIDEPQYDDDFGRSKKKRDFNDLRAMGFYNDDDF